jgi:Cytochrome P450
MCVNSAALVLGDSPLVAEQRRFVVQSLRNLKVLKDIEGAVQEEIREVVKTLAEEVAGGERSIQMSHRFSIPSLNGFWNLFMGERFSTEDPQLRKFAHNLNTYDYFMAEAHMILGRKIR